MEKMKNFEPVSYLLGCVYCFLTCIVLLQPNHSTFQAGVSPLRKIVSVLFGELLKMGEGDIMYCTIGIEMKVLPGETKLNTVN